ncbi:DMT family transporter [Limimaricola variabilis]|uniref:DMT family transporter n=1 Tax=Limimaricola variabilis TaxID=1492771 RepID=UPI002AC8BA29|nr:DMT family transporter [Limimaricola variabilis]WPY95945.1 DMT family transporter [Limimaricola variabilis]
MTARPTTANWLSILLLGLIWGGTFAVVRVALDGYGPITVACARTTLGALAMLGLMQAMGRRVPRLDRRLAGYLAAIGALSTALPFLLLAWGQQYVPSAFAGISMAALPLFVLPLAALFSDEPFSARAATGVGVGFAGALVLIGPGVLAPGAGLAAWGQMACLAAALSYAVASILTRRCPPVDGIVLTALSLAVGAVILLPMMLLTEGLPGWDSPATGAALIFLGLLPTALAALIRVTVIRSAGSVFMTLVNYQVPVWSMAIGALALGEALPWRFFAALALILTGLGISQGRNLQALFARTGSRPA